jgi:hypothetical protein
VALFARALLAQGQPRHRSDGSGGGASEPYGGFSAVFAAWLRGYLASLEVTAANPFVKDYLVLPARWAAGHARDCPRRLRWARAYNTIQEGFAAAPATSHHAACACAAHSLQLDQTDLCLVLDLCASGRPARRFNDPGGFSRATVRAQHPCFTTTSAAEYGAKPVTPLTMPLSW